MKDKLNGLYFITHGETEEEILDQCEKVLNAGVKLIQLRWKKQEPDRIHALASVLKKRCDDFSALLLINDHYQLALDVKAHGVHVGLGDVEIQEIRNKVTKDFIIGGTANTYEDIRYHQQQGADYIGLGPYHFTQTKEKLSPVIGLDSYKAIMSELKNSDIKLPVFAIGGIQLEDVQLLMEAGLDGLAVSGAIIKAEDAEKQCEIFIDEINHTRF